MHVAPALEVQVGQVLATADQILQTLLNQLVADTNDLLNRAAIAATDAATAGAVGATLMGGNASPAMSVQPFVGEMVIGGGVTLPVTGGRFGRPEPRFQDAVRPWWCKRHHFTKTHFTKRSTR